MRENPWSRVPCRQQPPQWHRSRGQVYQDGMPAQLADIPGLIGGASQGGDRGAICPLVAADQMDESYRPSEATEPNTRLSSGRGVLVPLSLPLTHTSPSNATFGTLEFVEMAAEFTEDGWAGRQAVELVPYRIPFDR